MSLHLDKLNTGSEIRQFASQLRFLEDGVKVMNTLAPIQGGNSEDFYRGLLAGASAAYSLDQWGRPELIGFLVAHIANFMESKEIT